VSSAALGMSFNSVEIGYIRMQHPKIWEENILKKLRKGFIGSLCLGVLIVLAYDHTDRYSRFGV
jgi:hypothetical protein